MQVLEEGQCIRHDLYGTGFVTESNAERTTIEFDNHGTRKFVTSLWTAEVIGEPPAKPFRRKRRSKKSAAKSAT